MKTIFTALFIALFTGQAFCACDARTASKIQRSDGYLKVCDGGTLEINSGATVTVADGSLAPGDVALATGKMLIGNASGVAAAQTLTGVVAVSSSGVISHVAGSIVNADINNSAAIADTKLATISTAGKVADAALSANVALLNSTPTISGTYTFSNTIAGSVTGNAATATNATNHIAEGASTEVHSSTSTNVVSTIVARDGSGNFSAGTITASLTGAASLNILKSGDTFTGKVGFAAKTLAELAAITPAALGEAYLCTDTSPARLAVSSGTSAGNFGDAMGLTLY